MRLLRTTSPNLDFVDIIGDATVQYAILSHTWGEDEVLFADVDKPHMKNKAGYKKISYAQTQAKNDGFDYLWVDTCCIDKSSSAELSEAINSMYFWYQHAAVCYVYLTDVDDYAGSHFDKSRWFTRGWTLQELLAAKLVSFFSKNWKRLGNKLTLWEEISKVTDIDKEFLLGTKSVDSASVAKRMSWASRRQTTRVEDLAYCLLGLFSVNMPLLYGEREKAFIRLQEEILKATDDQTIFVWQDENARDYEARGMLATSPRYFAKSASLVPCIDPRSREPPSITNGRLKIEVRMQRHGMTGDKFVATLACKSADATKTLSLSSHVNGRDKACILLERSSGSRREFRRRDCAWIGFVSCEGVFNTIIIPQSKPTSIARALLEERHYSIVLRHFSYDFAGKVRLRKCFWNYTLKRSTALKEFVRQIGESHDERSRMYDWIYPGVPLTFATNPFADELAVALDFEIESPEHPAITNLIVRIGLGVRDRDELTDEIFCEYDVAGQTKSPSYDKLKDGFSIHRQGNRIMEHPSTSGALPVGRDRGCNIKVSCNFEQHYHGPKDISKIVDISMTSKTQEITSS